jgi:SAM-dependent methyltransferase
MTCSAARPDRSSIFVWTGAACSYGCSVCPIDPGSSPPGTDARNLSRLPRLPERCRAARLAVLAGGDPFVRRDLFRMLAAARSSGYVPGLVTNARALVYPEARRRLRDAGVGYVRAQIFGWQAGHDEVTRTPGAFEHAIDGLRSFVAENDVGTKIDIALVLSPTALADLPGIVGRLAERFPEPDHHIVLDGTGIARAPDAASAAAIKSAADVLSGWNRDPSRPLLVWEGVAQSLVPAPQHLSAPPPAGTWLGMRAAPPATCMGPRSPGAAQTAREQGSFGTGPVANSFNYVRTEDVLPRSPTAAECAGADAGVDRDRCLWLAEQGQMVLYTTDTHDFAPPEIARVKRTQGQLFFDCSATATLDDFTRSLCRVVADPFCDACNRKDRCACLHRVADGSPFRGEEEWIAAQIAALRGRVLDVGCGEQLYRAALAPLVASRSVEYHGLDPDPAVIAELEHALPGGHYHVGPIEAFDGEPESFDHILCLRSFDHLADLGEAFARMAVLLRPGGTLLIVECTPCALLREARQVAWADQQPRAGHQHLRNWESADVLPLARLHSLGIEYHRAVGRETNNQWFLTLVREEEGPAGRKEESQ